MIDDSLTIRSEAMTARQRWTIFVASTGEHSWCAWQGGRNV
ncbi:hypothetical protein B0G77_6561 [Paraburkholderia sp. BL10I2N1]|nr:hypothetical protein B0G77_6561 [Paraburkholderia sp. BL10I2N1]